MPGSLKHKNADVFWGEIAPCDHIVQIYEDDNEILDALENFSDQGFKTGESVVIIATASHLNSLSERLSGKSYDLQKLAGEDRYITFKVEEGLSKFMRDGWPNEELFNTMVADIVQKGRGDTNRKIRAYGEMVAVLWDQGHNGATVHLEHLWNKLCSNGSFSLFCAYPKSGFTQDAHKSITHICSLHTKTVLADSRAKTQVLYTVD